VVVGLLDKIDLEASGPPRHSFGPDTTLVDKEFWPRQTVRVLLPLT